MKKKKIIKAQLGRMVKDTLSPQQRMQLDTYKKTVVDEMSNKESERRDQEQRDFYRKRFEEYQAQPKYRSERGPYAEDAMEEPRRKRMPSLQMEELSRVSEPASPEAAAEALDQLYKQSLNEMMQGSEGAAQGVVGKKKGGMVRGQGIAIRGTKFKGIF